MAEIILPYLDTRLGFVFEEVCPAIRASQQCSYSAWVCHAVLGAGGTARRKSDLLAELSVNGKRVIAAGECKWWKGPVGANVLADLRRKVRTLPAESQAPVRLALFSASGFTDELRGMAEQGEVVLGGERDGDGME